MELNKFIAAYIPIIVIGLILTISKGKVITALVKPITIYATLILWTLFGFIYVLDNSMQWGCFGGPGETLEIQNIIYSGLSVLLITIGFFSPDKIRLVILMGELIYWTFKLMKIKGGYVVGMGGMIDMNVLFFDSIALTLRLVLIGSFYDFGLKRRVYWIAISILIMTGKLLLFLN